MTSVLVLFLWTARGAWCLVFMEGANGGLGDGCLRWLLSRDFKREDQVSEKNSGAMDLPGVSSISGFRERLTRRKVALEEEVGSGSGGETQERAGAGEEVVGPVFKEEEAGEEG